MPLAYDLSRELVGEALADALGYPPRRGWGCLRLAAWPVLAGTEVLQRTIPALRTRAVRKGMGVAESIIAQILAGARSEPSPASTHGPQVLMRAQPEGVQT